MLMTQLLLIAGIAGPLLFVTVFLIEGAVREDYTPLRQPVSALSIGSRGWIQKTSFIITGLLFVAFAIGAWRVLRGTGVSIAGPLLIGLAGIGLIGAGLFNCDPLNGYPPGTPLVPTERTTHGRLHDLFGMPVFLGLPAAGFVFIGVFVRTGAPIWAVYSGLGGAGMFVAFVLAGLGFSQNEHFVEIAGMWQRISIMTGWTWIALLAVHMLTGLA